MTKKLPIQSEFYARLGRPPLVSDGIRSRHLIDVAEAVFLEKGFNATTMDEIARRAGMSKKTIYQIIPSKSALFDLLVAERLSPLFVPIRNDGRPAEIVLVEFLRQMAGVMLAPKQIALTRLLIAEAPSPEVSQALQRHGIGRGEGALEHWLEEQAAEETLTIDDPREAAAMLFGMTIGEFLIGQLACVRPAPSDQEVGRRIEQSVTMFLCGVKVGRASILAANAAPAQP